MSRKHVDLWVSRDMDVPSKTRRYIHLWSDSPEMDKSGDFYILDGALLGVFVAEDFAKLSGWTPRKGRKYPVTLEIKKRGK